jgi:serine/threonine-protein kinase
LVGKTIFGEYTISSKLGEGGMGAVYLATQQQIEQQVAIKVLHGRAARNDELVQRFYREAKTVTMLSHPNIIRVFIFGRTEEGLIYLAMEYVKGVSLRDELQNRGRMSEMRAIKILKQSLSALAEAHTLGIIHRDLKPDNILLTSYRGEDDFVKVLDFGIAKIKDPTGQQRQLTQAGVVYGTPEYLSPEQAQALELDHRSDVYSLGCILYEMVTGHVPFTAPKTVNILMMHVYEPAPPPSTKFPNISKEMEEIIMKALQKKPEQRYQTAMEFFEALVSREQELIRMGERISNIVMPGMEVTTSYVLPPEVIESAKAALAAPSQAAPLRTNTEKVSPAAVHTQGTAPVDKKQRTLLTLLIVMLGILLLVIIAGIALLMTK